MKHIFKFIFGLLFLIAMWYRHGGIILIMVGPFVIYGVLALIESCVDIAKENRKMHRMENDLSKKNFNS